MSRVTESELFVLQHSLQWEEMPLSRSSTKKSSAHLKFTTRSMTASWSRISYGNKDEAEPFSSIKQT